MLQFFYFLWSQWQIYSFILSLHSHLIWFFRLLISNIIYWIVQIPYFFTHQLFIPWLGRSIISLTYTVPFAVFFYQAPVFRPVLTMDGDLVTMFSNFSLYLFIICTYFLNLIIALKLVNEWSLKIVNSLNRINDFLFCILAYLGGIRQMNYG